MKLCPLIAAQVRPLSTQLHLPFHFAGLGRAVGKRSHRAARCRRTSRSGEAAPFPVLTHDTQQTVRRFAARLSTSFPGLTPAAALDRLVRDLWPEFRRHRRRSLGWKSRCGSARKAAWPAACRAVGPGILVTSRNRHHFAAAFPSEVPVFTSSLPTITFLITRSKWGAAVWLMTSNGDGAAEHRRGQSAHQSRRKSGSSKRPRCRFAKRLRATRLCPVFEQPLPAADPMGWRALRGGSRSPCADESVQTIDDALMYCIGRQLGW